MHGFEAGRFRTDRAREQVHAVGPDAAYATYAERDWNGLTQIVVVDLESRKRELLPFRGSFPQVHAGHVVFSSDPAFVLPTPDNSEFQQITRWTLYAVPVGTKRLCKIADFDNPVQIQ